MPFSETFTHDDKYKRFSFNDETDAQLSVSSSIVSRDLSSTYTRLPEEFVISLSKFYDVPYYMPLPYEDKLTFLVAPVMPDTRFSANNKLFLCLKVLKHFDSRCHVCVISRFQSVTFREPKNSTLSTI